MHQEIIDKLNTELEHAEPQKILLTVFQTFNDKVGFASSFGLEDQVITAMIAEVCPQMPVFTLDTGRLFPETYDLIEKTNARYRLQIKVYFPDQVAVESMVNALGINLFYDSVENRQHCCGVRKTQPLKRALSGLSAWVTGLRRSQSVTRTNLRVIEWDDANGLIKVNPLINWSEDEVKKYISQHKIPYNTLHDKGFPSIGCQPCTRAIGPGEDIRAGRWWWELPEQKECGLHQTKGN